MSQNSWILLAFAALVVSANGAQMSVPSENILGIKRIDYTSSKEIAVGVPWLQAADKDTTVAKLITTGLNEDDQIQVYSLADKAYFSWHYSGSEWMADTKTDGPAVPSAAEYCIKRGMAFWYKPVSDEGTITQVGSYSASAITTKVNNVHADLSEASFANPVHTLLANPKHEAFVINTLNDKCAENDVIIVLNNGARYRYEGGVWGQDIDQEVTKFGMTVTQKEFAALGEDGVIPAGVAFWYLSAGGAPEIEW